MYSNERKDHGVVGFNRQHPGRAHFEEPPLRQKLINLELGGEYPTAGEDLYC